jgi:hypothetical protein
MSLLKRLFSRYGPTASTADSRYRQLLEAAGRDPSQVDFTKLRLAYAASSEYDPNRCERAVIEFRRAFGDERNQDQLQQILCACEDLLASEPLSIWGRFFAGIYYTSIGDHKKVAYHRMFGKYLVKSILRSGDGRSYQTAFKVLYVNEEYFLLSYILNLKVKSQELIEWPDHEFDVIKAFDPKTGEPKEVYFNIDLIHKRVIELSPRTKFPWESTSGEEQ